MKRHLPNAITIGNLLSGMGGIFICLVYEDLFAAAACVVLAALLDVADGAVARWLRVSSPIGADLDSLADIVSFGVLPALMMIQILRLQGHEEAWVMIPACLAVCGALRLARFNNDPGQAKHFVGLPIPAAGLAMCGLAVQAANQPPAALHPLTLPAGVLACSVGVAGLMVSKLPMISLKLSIKTTWPYWLAVVAVSAGSLYWAEGAFTLVAIGVYAVASQVYFSRLTIDN